MSVNNGIKIYVILASAIMILQTLLVILEDNHVLSLTDFERYPFLVWAIFLFSFCNMFILPVVGIVLTTSNKKNIGLGILAIVASAFFLVFFMGLDSWDRF